MKPSCLMPRYLKLWGQHFASMKIYINSFRTHLYITQLQPKQHGVKDLIQTQWAPSAQIDIFPTSHLILWISLLKHATFDSIFCFAKIKQMFSSTTNRFATDKNLNITTIIPWDLCYSLSAKLNTFIYQPKQVPICNIES